MRAAKRGRTVNRRGPPAFALVIWFGDAIMSKSHHEQPHLTQRIERLVVRVVCAFVKVNLSDVHDMGLATPDRPKPAMNIIPNRITKNLEAPGERADINHEQKT